MLWRSDPQLVSDPLVPSCQCECRLRVCLELVSDRHDERVCLLQTCADEYLWGTRDWECGRLPLWCPPRLAKACAHQRP
eukprot:7610015-Prorocentrum_lima.AAC.1